MKRFAAFGRDRALAWICAWVALSAGSMAFAQSAARCAQFWTATTSSPPLSQVIEDLKLVPSDAYWYAAGEAAADLESLRHLAQREFRNLGRLRQGDRVTVIQIDNKRRVRRIYGRVRAPSAMDFVVRLNSGIDRTFRNDGLAASSPPEIAIEFMVNLDEGRDAR